MLARELAEVSPKEGCSLQLGVDDVAAWAANELAQANISRPTMTSKQFDEESKQFGGERGDDRSAAAHCGGAPYEWAEYKLGQVVDCCLCR
ncbi:hypothetical protein AB1Y20_008015 [Prymnesium parvum]|uniref:Uncharacterized protein n=1 Tax=Prymnesium parvum TaxID=97485 RepID=A0AB34IUA2_PRYPA